MGLRGMKILLFSLIITLSVFLAFSSYKVEVGNGAYSKTTANDVKEMLETSGFTPVEVIQKWNGFSVVIGDYRNKKLAEQVIKDLENEGYSAEIISELGGSNNRGVCRGKETECHQRIHFDELHFEDTAGTQSECLIQ